MAKLFVIERDNDERNPFLRGVLVESLVRAGLSFQDAYVVAQDVRGALAEASEITAEALKQQVSAKVAERFGEALAKAYEAGSSRERQILVSTPSEESPFSVGILSRSLGACAIDRGDALETAKQVYDALQQGEASVIDHLALRAIVYERLKEQVAAAAAERFLCWRRFKESGIPLIVLVGGITGTGKSTLTTELAYQLNVVRTQSTDMMREIVRCYLPADAIPTLSYSSFEAWRGLPEDELGPDADESKVVRGFLSQFAVVKDGLEATIYRAVKENHDLIVDGVHVLPWKLNLETIRPEEAIVVSVMLVVPNKKTLGRRLKRRQKEQPARESSRYLKRLDQIWTLQRHLVAEAEEEKIPLIYNVEIEEALEEVLLHVNKTIMRQFPPEG